MADNFERYDSQSPGAGFMMGLLTGTVLGAGLGMLLAPRAGAEIRGQIGEQARNLGNKASEQYRKASESASGWADRGREFMDKARDAVSRGAQEGREYGSGTSGSSYGGGSYGSGGSTGSSFGSGGSDGSSFGGSSSGDFGRS